MAKAAAGEQKSSLPSKGVNDGWEGGTLQLGQITWVRAGNQEAKRPRRMARGEAGHNASSAGGSCAKGWPGSPGGREIEMSI